MEPLGKMNAYFPIVNEHIAKRNKKVRPFRPLASPFFSRAARRGARDIRVLAAPRL